MGQARAVSCTGPYFGREVRHARSTGKLPIPCAPPSCGAKRLRLWTSAESVGWRVGESRVYAGDTPRAATTR